MSEERWEGPVLDLGRHATAYLCWLISRDLKEWGPERRTKLTREEATALAMYLSDHLPPEARTEVEPMPQQTTFLMAS